MQFLWSFLIGGILCAIAQILIDKTQLTPARILVSYVVAGVILTAIGVYGPFVKFASCGATVPLTGFGYSLARGVEKAVKQYGIIGALTGGLTGTAGGITAALVFGYLVALFSRGKPKM
jgi:stage V sporulation protein AE